ncbi:MAG: hypothetical protein C4530_13815 [Desulfobacteraceae bacterium]|nr:MAG: hypothetical protein C4530_13815 [Desulfobacteraceae bacterium]
MLQRILARNKKAFLRYNQFRKAVFSELSPEESEIILYLVPWLLCVNHSACPGFVPEMTGRIKIYNMDNDPEIRRRESKFQRKFGIDEKRSLLKEKAEPFPVQGLYTIGSIGTAGQTAGSDCDIWVCYDKADLEPEGWRQLNQKINLIKDWLDQELKMPVFFFLSEVSDIRKGRFGSLDSESSGSAQKNVLKEEFYRTCMVICGKIPLWWISYDPGIPVDYGEAAAALENPHFGLYDVIDLGNLARVPHSESFGAALWQIHKSLTRSLKSIIKMTLLEMQLDSPEESLPCHRFRSFVLSDEPSALVPDPIVFTMKAILDDYRRKRQPDRVDFLIRCFYLRCELKPYGKREALKKRITADLLKEYPLDIKERLRLSRFQTWNFDEQVQLGNRLFQFLIRMYKEISTAHSGIATEMDKQDLNVLGRKILVAYQSKPNKVPVLQKPTGSLNLSAPLFVLECERWNVYSGKDKSNLLVSNPDVIFDIAFLVWNDLFEGNGINMEPNPSSVTLQEIINLGKKMKALFGSSDVSQVSFPAYHKDPEIQRLLITVSFEKSPWETDINDFAVVFNNSWGELFVRRFHSPGALLSFFKKTSARADRLETSYYIQRNCASYEKIIERTKKIISLLS